MPENLTNKKVTTEPEIGSNGVTHSKMLGSVEGASPKEVSSTELIAALELSRDTIASLKKELAEAKKNNESGDSINKLAELIAGAISVNKPTGGSMLNSDDNINRSDDFLQRTKVDGRSLMEAQQTVAMFRNERKVPISISKTFTNYFGPALAITVNGVRVSIPCDGRTYMINETHAIHAKERMAKVDKRLSDTEPEIVEIDA